MSALQSDAISKADVLGLAEGGATDYLLLKLYMNDLWSEERHSVIFEAIMSGDLRQFMCGP